MAKPQHRTREHRAAYARIVAAQKAGEILWCVEPICKLRDRNIYPWQRASVSHDTTGTVITGDSHLACNLSEAASRGNRMRRRRPQPKSTPTTGRWVL